MELTSVLLKLRRELIINPLQEDSRSSKDKILGIESSVIFEEVIGGGQADFNKPWKSISAYEKVLLYAYYNQKGHIEEMLEAFSMLFKGSQINNPIVLDLGCGPYTAGLALSEVLGNTTQFSYIGFDRSVEMHNLGESLAKRLSDLQGTNSNCQSRQWVSNLSDVSWSDAPGWRPVIVVVSYLLASPSLEPESLIQDIDRLLKIFGMGNTVILYTNAINHYANRNFPTFKNALEKNGFEMIANENGFIKIDRSGKKRNRDVRYALFKKNSVDTLLLRKP
ncbi:MAG: hypothetical protein COW01_15640 [Bdellovibrionales bacterium CG12_big_fil_rev_8_21_14_0_65_38_15]|nr:MAG: hypothetical protein COW79_14805 [Bdellovibrionales bacterium CG22_combo_CG10-13_8_21_14_all_38_13]PIQ52403.1 MAG: hypothetical protein COW01_15640 [Bdellovibrionales bacterium CG12_big_fil_rev_8_21_14_0_65_38_15]PIR29441.1 MAG: hypothetical protein COV38_10180 [Bdellovibrionales bacterium CG11_big_fil_rev_8_21_14_0_20_38_13]